MCALPWRVRGRPRRRMPVKQACSDAIEESVSSTDEVAPQRKRARVCGGSPPSSTTHITFNTSCHLHITVSHSNNSTSHRTSHRTVFHKCGIVSWSVLTSLRLEANKTSFGNEHIRRPALVPALLNTRKFGGYAGTRVGEAQNPGPATHEGDWTVTEQPGATHRRINEAGDYGSCSQNSGTKSPCGISSPASPATANHGEFEETARPKQQPKEPRIPSLSAVRPSLRRPLGRLLMEVSCSIWCRSTEVRRCMKTVWDNCVGSISRPVCTVAQ